MGEAQGNFSLIFSAVRDFTHRGLVVCHNRYLLIVLFPETPLWKTNKQQHHPHVKKFLFKGQQLLCPPSCRGRNLKKLLKVYALENVVIGAFGKHV